MVRRFGGVPVVVVRSNEIGEVGFLLYADAAVARSLTGALADAGAVELDPETFVTLRLEAGRPAFPADMDQNTIPLEAGIESRAINQTKGCYVGQEVVIRILHRGRGRVAKRLVGLLLGTGDPAPDAGAALHRADGPDADPVGTVTTARRSPALGRPIALGYVKRELAARERLSPRRTAAGASPPWSPRGRSSRCRRRPATAEDQPGNRRRRLRLPPNQPLQDRFRRVNRPWRKLRCIRPRAVLGPSKNVSSGGSKSPEFRPIRAVSAPPPASFRRAAAFRHGLSTHTRDRRPGRGRTARRFRGPLFSWISERGWRRFRRRRPAFPSLP